MASYSAKDPSDVRKYTLDVVAAIPTGATVASVSAVALDNLTTPAGKDPAYGTSGDTTIYAWAGGGTAGQTGTITWTFVTSGGETLQRSATVAIKER